MSDWYNSFSYNNEKIYVYVSRNVNMNVEYRENTIQDLCEMWDSNNFELF